MLKTPKGFRLHIGLFGRRNVGKSSLLNAITQQDVSIVSDHAGTTTDPVEKPMELLPLLTELTTEYDAAVSDLRGYFAETLPELNSALESAGVPPVAVPPFSTE